MSESLAVIVLAHVAVQSLVDNHYKYWNMQGGNVFYVCPSGSKVMSACETITAGVNERTGRNSILRVRAALSLFCSKPAYSYLLLHEYDSVCISKQIHLTPGLTGNLVPMTVGQIQNYTLGDPFAYLNAPWIMDKDSALQMKHAMNKYPEFTEGGYVDRYLSALARLCGIPLLNHCPIGYSDHTNDECCIETNSDSFSIALKAVQNGATMIHGIKGLNTADRFYEARMKAGLET